MSKLKLRALMPLTVALFAVVAVQAESDKRIRPVKTEPTSVSEIKPAATSLPQTSPVGFSKQGYQMVTGVLDGFGGESESNNFRIPVSSGGQPSPAGISESASWGMKAGFVYASHVNRGDVNADGVINVADIVYLVNFLYRGGPAPCPMEAGDLNCDGIVNVADIVFLVNYLYRGGSPPCEQ